MSTWEQVKQNLQEGSNLTFQSGDFVRFACITPDQFSASRRQNKWRKNVYVVKCRVKRGGSQVGGNAWLTEKQAIQVIELNGFDGEGYGPVLKVSRDDNGVSFELGQA